MTELASTTGKVTVFAPASVSNVSCGFDVLGFAIEGLGDLVTAVRTERPGVVIDGITGDQGRLPVEASRNTAGRAATEVLARLGTSSGVSLRIQKQMPISSGLGSSAASAVAGALATSLVLGDSLSESALLECAIAGESLASGAVHADNVAPSMLGGFVLVRSLDPEPDVVPLPVPDGLHAAVVRAPIEIDTAPARRALPSDVPLAIAAAQWANVGALVAALYRQDLELLGRSMCDLVAEPVRAELVPGFHQAQNAAVEAGALGCSLSGSGPALFALCPSPGTAKLVARAMADQLEVQASGPCDVLLTPVGARGARVVPASAP